MIKLPIFMEFSRRDAEVNGNLKNTATNVLIDYLGIDEYNKGFEAMGLKITKLRRKLFDFQAGSNS